MKLISGALVLILTTQQALGLAPSGYELYNDSQETIFEFNEAEEMGLENLNLTDEEIEEILSFYTEEDFATGLWAEIRGQLSFADSAITSNSLKEIFPQRCDIIIDKIASTVRSEVSDVMLDGARDVKAACPQWQNLTTDDRKDFYVALVTAMALAESSCNNGARNGKASNGTAYGLWQARKPMSPVQGARWVMNQMESQIKKSGLIFWSNSNLNYWAVLNPKIHAHKVKKLLKKIPACVARAVVSKK